MGSAIRNEGPVDSIEVLSMQFYTTCRTWALSYVYSTNLSTGPPRPPRPLSCLLLVSGSQEGVNKNKRVSLGVRKWRSSVLLSVAAKLRVVAERDLRNGKTNLGITV